MSRCIGLDNAHRKVQGGGNPFGLHPLIYRLDNHPVFLNGRQTDHLDNLGLINLAALPDKQNPTTSIIQSVMIPARNGLQECRQLRGAGMVCFPDPIIGDGGDRDRSFLGEQQLS